MCKRMNRITIAREKTFHLTLKKRIVQFNNDVIGSILDWDWSCFKCIYSYSKSFFDLKL